MPDKQTQAALVEEWRNEERIPFSGWDFSHLRGRCIEDTPPWSYESMVRELLPRASSVLDLGTGGGEKLRSFRDVLPRRTVATEGHRPNLELARKRLEPIGIEVVEANDSLAALLPFAAAEFDLVIDRHTAFNIAEVERVLKPGGIFLTQQVDGSSCWDLIEAFGSKPKWPWFTLSFMLDQVKTTNLVVDLAQDWAGGMVITDVGALVYYLRAIPWLVEGFSVNSHLPYLRQQQERLEREGVLAFVRKLLVLRASKM